MSRLMNKDEKHILHTYKRSDTNPDIYKCLHPYCTHYIKKDFLENKASLCPKCGEEMILDRKALNKRIPVCLQCSRSPKKYVEKTAEKIITDVLADLNFDMEDEEENE